MKGVYNHTCNMKFLTSSICFLLMAVYLCESHIKIEDNERNKRGLQRLPCTESFKTIVQGFCPNDTTSRNARAKELDCENKSKSCKDSKDFVYHCVLNEWGNGSIEICAPSTKIIGQFCAEFNLGGAIVQEHHKTNITCNMCPFVYNSTESFRYSECFKRLPKTSTGSKKQNSSHNSLNQLIGLIALLGLIFLIVGTTVFVLKKRITSQGQHMLMLILKENQNA